MSYKKDVTLCITSCDRLPLLQETLRSFLPAHKQYFAETIIIEDGRSKAVKRWLKAAHPNVRLIMNTFKLGHLRSVDRMYEEVKTPYIFHGEDDWLFENQDVILPCKRLLEADDSIDLVCVRKLTDMRSGHFHEAQFHELNGVRFYVLPLEAHSFWGAFTFNPSLVRRRLWEQYGPYNQYVTEAGISARMKADGKKAVFLDPGSCVHIGWEDHVIDPFQKGGGKTFAGKLKNSISKRFRSIVQLGT